MTLTAIVQTWRDSLARLLLRARRRRSVIVRPVPGGYELEGGASTLTFGDAGGEGVRAGVARIARGARIILRLDPTEVAVRRVEIPRAGLPYVEGIVRSRIDRLSPWPQQRTVYGFHSGDAGGSGSAREVAVFLASLDDVEAHAAVLLRFGCFPDLVSVRMAPGGPDVALSGMRGATEGSDLAMARRIVTAVLLLIGASTAAASLWMGSESVMARREADDALHRITALRRTIASAATGASPSGRPLSREEQAWAAKATTPPAIAALEAATRLLPDHTYLTEFRLEGRTLRIVGVTASAPGLVPALERSAAFSDVRFFAPTVRRDDGRFRVHLETLVEFGSRGSE